MMKRISLIALLIVGIAGPLFAGEAALAEVNAARAKRGLPAFLPDPALTVAADKAAAFRAARLIQGHSANDFQFVPQGSRASAAGCAAWGPRDGFGSCCMYERWKYCGAAWATGRDGRRYMHVFVR